MTQSWWNPSSRLYLVVVCEGDSDKGEVTEGGGKEGEEGPREETGQ